MYMNVYKLSYYLMLLNTFLLQYIEVIKKKGKIN